MILQEREQCSQWIETQKHMPEQDQIAGQSHLEFIGYTQFCFLFFLLKGGTLLIRSCLWKSSAGQQQSHKQKVQQPQTLIGLRSSHGALWC